MILIPIFINFYVKLSVKGNIISVNEVNTLKHVDAVLVLGCRAYSNGPSPLLKNRLDRGLEVYNNLSTKLLLSGDHGTSTYDEVNTMRDYVLTEDILTENIFLDHAGFSTYDSLYRAKKIFNCKKMIIVTQEYHLYRALYIAKQLGLEAYGVSANEINTGFFKREVREILARNKDFIKVMVKPQSKYLGDTIPITGDGTITLDKIIKN